MDEKLEWTCTYISYKRLSIDDCLDHDKLIRRCKCGNVLVIDFYENKVLNCCGIEIDPYQDSMCIDCINEALELEGIKSPYKVPWCIYEINDYCRCRDSLNFSKLCLESNGYFCPDYKEFEKELEKCQKKKK